MSQGLSSANSCTTRRTAWRTKKRENLIVSAEFLNTNILEAIFLSRFLHYILTLLEMGFCYLPYKEFWKYTVWILEEVTLIYQKYQSAILHIYNFLRTILCWKKIYVYINTEYFPIFRSLVLMAGLKFVE